MGFLKNLFTGREESEEELKRESEAKRFDMFKYDGVKAARIGQFDYAVKCFQEALSIKDDFETRDYLSRALLKTEHFLEAYEELLKLSQEEKDNKRIPLNMARVAYMMEDYDRMAQALDLAAEIDPEEPQMFYLRALAAKGQENYVETVAMLTKALALRPFYAEAALLRGQTLLKMGDINGADDDVKTLMLLTPDGEEALMLKARVEQAEGKDDLAIETFGQVIEINPFAVDAYRERGAIRYANGDMKAAKEDMEKVLELNPNEAADVSGEYSAEGVEYKVKQAYSNVNPLGI